MHDHRHEETARDFLARQHKRKRAAARVSILRILGNRMPEAFLIDPRTGKPFLLLQATETRHYPHGAGSPA